MNNREVIEAVIKAFDKKDTPALLEYFTDNIEWNMLGDQVTKGKEAIRQMFAADHSSDMVGSTVSHLVVDGDTAVADGEVTMKNKDGNTSTYHYCDLYELVDGKVNKMVTYMVPKK